MDMQSQLYPALYAPKDGYVFVVTYGRSGSTLTQSLLNAIPGYCIRGENGNLTYFLSRAIHMVTQNEMYTWRREDILKPREERRGYLKNILGQPYDPWAGAENVDPIDFGKSLMNVFVEKILQLDNGCRVGGLKEIRFHEDPNFFESHLNYIKNIFPNARFVFQTRNLDAVSKSSWWANKPKGEVIRQLEKAEGLFSDFSEKNKDICFTLRYDMISQGVSYVRGLYDFLGENVSNENIEQTLGRKLKH